MITTDDIDRAMKERNRQMYGDAPTMPPLEHYLRAEVELASGINVAAGLEHRPEYDTSAETLLDAMDAWAQLAASESDVGKFARRWGAYAVVNHPDRYWFVEVWRGDKRGYYQIIQRPPWKAGGFAP